MTYNPDNAAFAAPDRRQTLQEQWREVSARIDAEDALRRTAEAEAAALLPATDAAGRTLRHDGWTPERQRAFLCAIAEGETVERACRAVGLSVSSVYAFRQRAAGAAFALGWHAAGLLGRERIADRMMTRAIDGQVETVTRPDGSTITRHRFDNRTGLAMLVRLDRMAEQVPADPAAAASSHAARLVAQDFEAFLDVIEQDRGPAQAGLFLARRTGLAATPAGAPDLEPILALARADRFVRTGTSLAEEVDTRDLDLAQRHGWTAEQWQRADAAGLLRIATVDEAGGESREASPLPPLVDAEPVAWDDDAGEYRTHLPPPEGEEPAYAWGEYGDEMYERGLTDSEQALMDRIDELDAIEQRLADSAERDAWFAQIEAEIAAAEAEGGDETVSSPIPGTSPFPGESRGPVPDQAMMDTRSALQDDVETPEGG
ncbi:hypothetical protein [uncultured Sphingomonas sp.]|uniref:hypothetical protein n=1 Tax=uncultured Sphingomonas sp. TaxID=158754 RepID=UPI0035C98450